MSRSATTWRYAVTVVHHPAESVYEVREVYTDPDGALSWTADAVGPHGDSWMELYEDVSRMSRDCATRKVLNITDEKNPTWESKRP